MSASQQTRYYHGASPGSAGGDVTGSTVRHKQADNDIQDANNPIPVPLTGLSFGWRKSSKENWTTPPLGAISDLVWFLTGTPATGQYVYARVQSVGIYVVATSADQSGITGFTDTAPNRAANLATLYTSSSPLAINAGTVLSNPNTGEGSQDFLETQMALDSTYAGGAGPITALTVTYRYVES
jgi:hypothetical protein